MVKVVSICMNFVTISFYNHPAPAEKSLYNKQNKAAINLAFWNVLGPKKNIFGLLDERRESSFGAIFLFQQRRRDDIGVSTRFWKSRFWWLLHFATRQSFDRDQNIAFIYKDSL